MTGNKNQSKIQQKTGFFLGKKVGKAISDYQMLKDGDKVAVAVSGGKDSLTLLHILNERRKFVPIKYDLLALHIDFGNDPPMSKRLERYFKQHGYPYIIKKAKLPPGKNLQKTNCFWCAWNRRKAIFELSVKHGCSKIAFGHHLDDIVETVLLNLFLHGNYSAMAPKQELFQGKIVVIRPLAYTQEREITRFARYLDFPCRRCACPHGVNSQRAHVGRIIRDMEKVCPQVRTNIFRAMRRIKKDYLL